MKILLIHQAFVSPYEAGGTRHFDFAKYCKKEELEISIIASNLSYLTGKPTRKVSKLSYIENYENVEVYRAKTIETLHKSFRWRIVSFLSFTITSILVGLKLKDIKLVIGTSPPIFQAISSLIISKVKRVPFVLEIRDLWPEFAIDMKILKNNQLIYFARLIEKLLYNNAKHIIVNSPAYKTYIIKKYNIKYDKITLIANGVDISNFRKSNKTIVSDSKSIVITYAGAIGYANDIGTILKAAKYLEKYNNIKFIIAGDGMMRNKMINYANQLSLKNIQFIGAIPKKDMPDLLSNTDICIATLLNIPMFKTTYPNKVFDYMAAGKPILFCIDGVIRKVIEKADCGLYVEPSDHVQLAKNILKLSQDKKNINRLGDNGRQYVEKHFNRSKQAILFKNLINNISNGN